MNPPVHRSYFFSPAVGSWPLLYAPGEEDKDLLVFLPVREVMLRRRVTVGDFCWGGVRHCFPSSSSDVEDTSSPMRIRSRLPSSTPFPSHRPQGNLQRAQHKHSSATQHSLILKLGDSWHPRNTASRQGMPCSQKILTEQSSAGAAPAPQLIILRDKEICKAWVTQIFYGPHVVFWLIILHLQPELICSL